MLDLCLQVDKHNRINTANELQYRRGFKKKVLIKLQCKLKNRTKSNDVSDDLLSQMVYINYKNVAIVTEDAIN